MTERIVKPLSFWETMKEVFVFYSQVYRPIFLIVLYAAILQALTSWTMPENRVIAFMLWLFTLLIAIFLNTWLLAKADNVYMKQPEAENDSLRIAKKRYLNVLGASAAYFVLATLLSLFVIALTMLGRVLHLPVLLSTIGIAIVTYILVTLTFTIPAIVIDNQPIFKGFETSFRLMRHHWWYVFGLLIIFGGITILLALGVLYFIHWPFIAMTYEFIVHLLTYPLMISFLIVMYHDLKSRHQIESFKHVAEPHVPHDTPF